MTQIALPHNGNSLTYVHPFKSVNYNSTQYPNYLLYSVINTIICNKYVKIKNNTVSLVSGKAYILLGCKLVPIVLSF